MGQSERRPPPDPVRSALVALANPNKSAVLVVGPAGSGKSRVLSQVRSRLEATESGRHRPLVVLDDVDLLDPPSLALLADNLDRQAIRLVASARVAAPVLRGLRPLRPPSIVPLEPWRRAEVGAFAAEQVGGVLHELTLDRLMRFSGGNPLCVTEIVDAGVASGRLHRAYGCWAWRGELTVPPLIEARVAGRLDELTEAVRDVHATVALAGVAELAVLEAVFPAAVVEAADDAGLLRVESADGRLRVRAAVPVEAAVAVQTLSATRRRRLAGAYAAALPGDPARTARLLTLAGTAVPAELRVPAAAAALRTHDPALAEALLSAPLPPGPGRAGPSAAGPADPTGPLPAGAGPAGAGPAGAARGRDPVAAGLLAEAVLMQGEPGRAAAVLPETAPLRPFLRLLDGQELDPAERTSLPVVAWTAEGLHRPETSGLAAAAVLAQTGDLAAALAAAGPDGAEGLIRVHHLAVVGWCELARGRVEAAEQCAADLRALGRSEDWPYPYGLGALLGGLCALAAGRARRAALLLSESTVSGPAYARSYGLTQLALAYARAGDGEAADRASFDADRIVSARTPRLLADLADLTRAEVLLARGRHGGALRTATAVVERCEGTGRVLATVEALHLLARLDHSAATAARLAAAAAGLPAAAGLSAAAGFSAAAGLSAAAGPAAADAGGGEAVAADGLGTAAALDVRVRHARALADGDGEALAQVATEYDATGRHWLAGETAAASLALAGPGSRASWATTDRRILERAGTQADVELPAQWRGGDRFAPLTQREREITELAAGGWSSPRIAAQLHLSRRTVENHLQHSYRKLGVGRREELAAALGRSAATG